MEHKCPGCGKEFEEIVKVVTGSLEPYTAIALDPMAGLDAWGSIFQQKETICHHGNFVHFRFVDDGEERLVEMLPYEPEAIAAALQANEANEVVCEHEGCESKETAPYYMTPLEREPHAYYCADHAYGEGFCTGCRQFLAGFESFDFSPGRSVGLCSDCYHELQSEMDDGIGDYDDYEEYDDFEY